MQSTPGLAIKAFVVAAGEGRVHAGRCSQRPIVICRHRVLCREGPKTCLYYFYLRIKGAPQGHELRYRTEPDVPSCPVSCCSSFGPISLASAAARGVSMAP